MHNRLPIIFADVLQARILWNGAAALATMLDPQQGLGADADIEVEMGWNLSRCESA